MSDDAQREKNLDAGSRMHMLDWIESSTFLEEVRQLVSPCGLAIDDDAFYRPRGRHDWRESTLIGADDAFLSRAQARQLRDWWLVHHRGAKLPTWDLALAARDGSGKSTLVLFEAKAHHSELSDAGKPLAKRETHDEQMRSKANHDRIAEAIAEASAALKISICRDSNYQFANRIAFAWKIATMGVPVVLIYLGFTGDSAISPQYFTDDAAWHTAFRSHLAGCIPDAMLDSAVPTANASFWILPRSRERIRLSPARGQRRRLPISGAGRATLHLIRPLDGSLPDVETRLREAHDYLARCGAIALQQASSISAAKSWGCAVKREKVLLPTEGKPAAVPAELTSHSLGEIINQCATVERLLDVLAWARSDAAGLSNSHVECCHPTTSSFGEADATEHDLVLNGPETIARFEICDVASSEDGNEKARKDLARLGVFGEDDVAVEDAASKPARLFLAVSEEFAAGISTRWPSWRKQSGVQFHVIDLPDTSTKLVEVSRMLAPALAASYREAVFLASEPADGWPKEWGIITAYDPPGSNRMADENKAANARLRERVAEWRHFEITGASPDLTHREPSFGVEAPLPKLLELGRTFQQAAIFWVSRGVIYLYPCQPSERHQRIGKWDTRWRK